MENASSRHSDERNALGFRKPAARVTEPCLTYMARVMELREFIGFYFNFVKSSEHIAAKLKSVGAYSALDNDAGLSTIAYNFSRHRQLVNEIILSRAVESFDLYVVSIMRDVFIAKPELLKSEGAIDVSSVIEAGSYNEIIYRIADKKIHDLSYKSLADLRRFICSRVGVDLFGAEDIFNLVLAASEARNLIAHNDCVVNEVFRAKTKNSNWIPEISDTGKLKISDDWVRQACYALDGIVFDFDQAMGAKFNLLMRLQHESIVSRD